MIRFASLGSGSEGNGMLVEAGDTCLLLDCGFTVKETVRRLARLGRAPEDVTGILVTHEHGDHLSGVGPLARRYGLPVWMTAGTASVDRVGELPVLHLLNSHEDFTIGAVTVRPFPVPHDAREPCQFVFRHQELSLGVLTDLGSTTPWIQRMLDGVDGLVLECNHDIAMLASGRYPDSLKARVGGNWGHLNNRQAAGLLASLERNRLQHLVAAHLSRENNAPALVAEALAPVLDGYDATMTIACQDDGFGWMELD